MLQALWRWRIANRYGSLMTMSKTASALAVLLLLAPGGFAAPAPALNPYEARVELGTRNAVDDLVFA